MTMHDRLLTSCGQILKPHLDCPDDLGAQVFQHPRHRSAPLEHLQQKSAATRPPLIVSEVVHMGNGSPERAPMSVREARAVGKEGYVPLGFGRSLRITELSPAVWSTSSW